MLLALTCLVLSQAQASEKHNSRSYHGSVRATLNFDKDFAKRQFVREKFDEYIPTEKKFIFTGDKNPTPLYYLSFTFLSIEEDDHFILEATLTSDFEGKTSVVFTEVLEGALYGQNNYKILYDDKPSLEIGLEIDKNFTKEELRNRLIERD